MPVLSAEAIGEVPALLGFSNVLLRALAVQHRNNLVG